MKKIDLGHITTILANLGVIAGIAFLAVELRQNNQLIDEQSVIARVNVYATHASSGVAARGYIRTTGVLRKLSLAGYDLGDRVRPGA
jgi:hypothetical protein